VQQQLTMGGRLFVVVGEAPVMEATMVQRIAADSFKHDVLFETCLPSLDNAPQPERFEF
jgi:protein-L-isoaspartate(D-aspartate) O-methyltransferase